MNTEYLKEVQNWARAQLETCVNFWLKHGMDNINGGVYTCLDRTRNIYSTDSCIDSMEKYCINREAGGRLYFMVTADGRPLRQRRYYFSKAFYIIANMEYYGTTSEYGTTN